MAEGMENSKAEQTKTINSPEGFNGTGFETGGIRNDDVRQILENEAKACINSAIPCRILALAIIGFLPRRQGAVVSRYSNPVWDLRG
jgi:hypothetical protein